MRTLNRKNKSPPDHRLVERAKRTFAVFPLVRLRIEDLIEDAAYDIRDSVRIDSELVAPVVTIIVASAKTLAEIVLVVRKIDIARIAKGSILVCEVVIQAVSELILAIRLTSLKPLLVAQLHCLPHHVCGVPVYCVVDARPFKPVAWRRVVEVQRCENGPVAVFPQAREVPLLKPPSRHPSSVSHLQLSLLSNTFLPYFTLPERINPALLARIVLTSLKSGLDRLVPPVIPLSLLLLQLILLMPGLLFSLPGLLLL